MKLVKIGDDQWINPKKVIMVREGVISIKPFKTGVFLTDDYIVKTNKSIDEVVAIINGGLDNA